METPKEKLKRILDEWDNIPIRAYKDGKPATVFLSEVSEARQAYAIMGWMSNYDEALSLAYELIHTMWGGYIFNK